MRKTTIVSSLSNRYLKHSFPQGADVEVFELPDLTPQSTGNVFCL